MLTTAVTGVAAIDLFSGKRWTATPVHRLVRILLTQRLISTVTSFDHAVVMAERPFVSVPKECDVFGSKEYRTDTL